MTLPPSLPFPAFVAGPRVRVWGGALLLASLVSGCANHLLSDTANAQLVAVPSTWNASAALPPGPELLAQWWQRFNDPQLTALVTQALIYNTDVQSALAAVRKARALRNVAEAGLQPSLNMDGSARRSTSGSGGSNLYAAGFDASWEPDVFGGNHSKAEATRADEQAAVATLAQTQVSLAAEVAVSYIELRGLQARLDLARLTLSSQTETLQLVRWRAQAGLASALDVAQALTAAEQTQAQLPALEGSLAQAANSLAVLTGQPPGQLNGLLHQPQPVPQTSSALTLAIPAQTLRQRPDIRVAEQQVAAALARVQQADAARYPSFSISGSLGRQALTLGALTSGPASLANALIASVSWPIWDGGATQAQVQAQQAALDSARINYQAAVLTALKDVENALLALDYDRQQLDRLQAAAVAAAEAESLASLRYRSGLVDFATVLTTQRTLLSARDNAASALATLSADHVRLYKALGGGWMPEAPAPTTTAAATATR